MLSKSKSKQHQLFKYALLIPLVFSMLLYSSANSQDLKTSNLSDEELKEKFYNEIIELEGIDVDFLKNSYERIKPNLSVYIVSREEYYKSGAYMRLISEKVLASKIAKGESTIEYKKMMTKIHSKTYQEYLEFKKTARAKEIWENNVHDGLLRIVVDDLDNLTEDDKKRVHGKELLMKNDDYYTKLIISDGRNTKEIHSPNKSNTVVKNERGDVVDSVELDASEVPFAVIDEVPLYSGCESLSTNGERKSCMSEKITKHVIEHFNTKIGKQVGLKGKQRVMVIFKIDKEGNVMGVRARAPHPKLETEAIRVIKLLPQFKPGKQKGETVIVPYSLPIVFEVK